MGDVLRLTRPRSMWAYATRGFFVFAGAVAWLPEIDTVDSAPSPGPS